MNNANCWPKYFPLHKHYYKRDSFYVKTIVICHYIIDWIRISKRDVMIRKWYQHTKSHFFMKKSHYNEMISSILGKTLFQFSCEHEKLMENIYIKSENSIRWRKLKFFVRILNQQNIKLYETQLKPTMTKGICVFNAPCLTLYSNIFSE